MQKLCNFVTRNCLFVTSGDDVDFDDLEVGGVADDAIRRRQNL